jgi:4-carboxymuconolactone decarboxylase
MDDVVPKGETTERLDRTRRRSEKMPRLPMPSDSEPFAEETRAAVRHILETRNSMPPPSSYLTYAGQAGALLSDLVEHLRYHTSLTDAETELAICTSARASNADFIWSGHVRLGLQAGTREEAIHAVDTHGPLDGLTADEALIIRFGRELLESPQVSDDTFNTVRARYGERGLMELTALMSVYTMNANILRVMDHRAAADARHLTPR